MKPRARRAPCPRHWSRVPESGQTDEGWVRLAPRPPMCATVHASERQPGNAEQGKCDRDADFVQEVRPRSTLILDLSIRGDGKRVFWGSPMYPSDAFQIP